jgi:hypothetical protein
LEKAKIRGTAVVAGEIHIVLTEDQARALNALAGYGTDAFLRVFYEGLGSHYLKPYEKGLRELLDEIRDGDMGIGQFMRRMDQARAAFNK